MRTGKEKNGPAAGGKKKTLVSKGKKKSRGRRKKKTRAASWRGEKSYLIRGKKIEHLPADPSGRKRKRPGSEEREKLP